MKPTKWWRFMSPVYDKPEILGSSF